MKEEAVDDVPIGDGSTLYDLLKSENADTINSNNAVPSGRSYTNDEEEIFSPFLDRVQEFEKYALNQKWLSVFLRSVTVDGSARLCRFGDPRYPLPEKDVKRAKEDCPFFLLSVDNYIHYYGDPFRFQFTIDEHSSSRYVNPKSAWIESKSSTGKITKHPLSTSLVLEGILVKNVVKYRDSSFNSHSFVPHNACGSYDTVAQYINVRVTDDKKCTLFKHNTQNDTIQMYERYPVSKLFDTNRNEVLVVLRDIYMKSDQNKDKVYLHADIKSVYLMCD